MPNQEHPDLSSAQVIGLDIETYDPELQELGTGVYRRDGNILGFSVSVDGFKEYYNLAHPNVTYEERVGNYQYLKDVCATSVPKVGAKLMYDLDWIENWAGIKVNGRLHDIQMAEPLLNEYRGSYNLEELSKDYLKRGKTVNECQRYAASHGYSGEWIKWLYKMPHSVVRGYAMDDADNARLILPMQLIELQKQELRPLYDMETGLIRPLLAMRKTGVRLNEPLRDEFTDKLEALQLKLEARFQQDWGHINVNSPAQIAPVFDRLGIEYPTTKKGNPSMPKDVLEMMEHPIAKQILEIRQIKQCLGTFFNSAFRKTVKGRIHGDFIPNKMDEGGTVTGRMSASKPNLQQITSPDRDKAREEPLGKMCRQLFMPEEGCQWLKIDYSQIEYRVITHFACGPMAEEMREKYRTDPKTDFHQMAIQWARELAQTDLSRSKAKNLGFGTAYFMGIPTMMEKFHWTKEEAKALQQVYFTAFPFIEPTRKKVVTTGDMRGYVKTPLGRRCHVTPEMRGAKPRPKTYIIFNHLIQGTAADVLKASLKAAWDYGIFDVLNLHLIVHDEFGASMPDNRIGHEAARELKRIMETTVPLSIPVVADPEVGPTWGDVKDCDLSTLS